MEKRIFAFIVLERENQYEEPDLAGRSVEVGVVGFGGGALVGLAGGRAVTDQAGLPGALEVLSDGEIVGFVPVPEHRDVPAPVLGVAVAVVLLESNQE